MMRARGVTLVEVLVALVITSVALSAAVLAANAQQRAYYAGHRTRAAQEAARDALLILERKLPLAGYGMDAPFALDFKWYVPKDFGTCPAEADPCSPDAVDGPDEITFYGRNPAYWVEKEYGKAVTAEPAGRAWNVLALHGNTLTLRAHAGDRFRKGQVLQVVCAAELDYAFFTVAATTPLPDPVTLEGTELEITLEPVVAANPFRRQDIAVGLACFGDPATAYNAKPEAKAFQIDRYRYHVRPIQVGDRYQPYLMLDAGVDRDLDGDVDADDEVFLVEGIESLQFAYVFGEPAIPVAGTIPGTPIAFADPGATAPGVTPQTIVTTQFTSATPPPSGKNDYDVASFYPYSTITPVPQRRTNAQANVRRLLVSVVARSPDPDPTGNANLVYEPGSPLYTRNQVVAPDWVPVAPPPRGDGYQRSVVESTVALPNMLTRSVSYF